jgi:serine/threonine-protein kinase RsbW
VTSGRILAKVGAEHFVGRESETELLARDFAGREPIALLAVPAAGSSELLRQTYDRLFSFQTDAIPFYFAVKPSDADALACARRFAFELALQAVAFRRNSAGLQFAIREPAEIVSLADDADAEWLSQVAALAASSADVRSLLSALVRASITGVRIFPIIDDLHGAESFPDGNEFLNALVEVLGHLSASSVICGQRRYLSGRTPFATRHIERLRGEALADVIDEMAARLGVVLAEQPRDLIAVQLDGNLQHIEAILRRAASGSIAIGSYADFEKLYAEEIFGGSIAESIAGAAFPDTRELDSDPAAADCFAARAKLDSAHEPRAKIIGDAILEYTERAPKLMNRHYRSLASIDVRSLLASFDGREVPLAFIDYARYKAEIKGRRDVTAEQIESGEKFALPKIVFAAHGAHFYPQISEIADTESTAVGMGFNGNEKIVWIAAEVDSKLEADAELAEFCCDRIEMIGVAAGFASFRLWLIAPEGFDDEARELLAERNAIGSSRKQVQMLREYLSGDARSQASESYELVIPMGDDTEIVAAQTLEVIAERHGFSGKAINQMKTALVEACINAAEHSLSPDRKTSVSVGFSQGELTIAVANRGIRLPDKQATTKSGERRGWGLKLIESLMDAVTIEPRDDGTRLVMKKKLDA